jgi:hypothetical protein
VVGAASEAAARRCAPATIRLVLVLELITSFVAEIN